MKIINIHFIELICTRMYITETDRKRVKILNYNFSNITFIYFNRRSQIFEYFELIINTNFFLIVRKIDTAILFDDFLRNI